jgi:hypothetical protein
MIFLCPSLPRSFTCSHSVFYFLPHFLSLAPSHILIYLFVYLFILVQYPNLDLIPSFLHTFSRQKILACSYQLAVQNKRTKILVVLANLAVVSVSVGLKAVCQLEITNVTYLCNYKLYSIK